MKIFAWNPLWYDGRSHFYEKAQLQAFWNQNKLFPINFVIKTFGKQQPVQMLGPWTIFCAQFHQNNEFLLISTDCYCLFQWSHSHMKNFKFFHPTFSSEIDTKSMPIYLANNIAVGIYKKIQVVDLFFLIYDHTLSMSLKWPILRILKTSELIP